MLDSTSFISSSPLTQTLKEHAVKIKQQNLLDLFSKDKNRVKNFSIQLGDIYFDFSKNLITQEIFHSLCDLAQSQDLTGAIKQLFSGVCVNTTENRPALHMALRQEKGAKIIVDGEDVMPSVIDALEKMYDFVNKLHNNELLGVTGKPIKDIVNLGIGGSDLGPKMVTQALKPYHNNKCKVYYVSNLDPSDLQSVLEQVNPEQTLFAISSKSFTTEETLTNARVAIKWLQNKLQTQDINSHLLAITANPQKAQGFGILSDNILPFANWVGGRFSVWSTIGFGVAVAIGPKNFNEFLKGANFIDKHFSSTPLSSNVPVIMALLGIWYTDFLNAQTYAVLPYDHNLQFFTEYLQQLEMESNGKAVKHNGEQVNYATAPITWGSVGTNGQHAFYQLLHQGTHLVPVDFIVSTTSHTNETQQHRAFLSHCLAQARALMVGNQDAQFPHQVLPGNKPSNMFLLNKLTPFNLGSLIALYEHKVYVQGVIWQINSFDQPGVELGKKMANTINSILSGKSSTVQLDPSTQELVNKVFTP